MDTRSEAPEQVQEMSAEQSADLNALKYSAQQSTQAMQELQAGQEPEPEPQGPTLAEEVSGMLTLLVGMLGPIFPSLAAIYTEQVIQSVGVAVQPVCDKHGWLQGGIGGKYGEEIMALVVLAPLTYATYSGITADIAARVPTAPEKQHSGLLGAPKMEAVAPAINANSNTVTIGAVVQ